MKNRIDIRIDDKLDELLTERELQSGLSRSEIIRQLLKISFQESSLTMLEEIKKRLNEMIKLF